MKTRLWIAALIYPMVNAVLFGAGAIAMLSIPALDAIAPVLFPVVIAASFVLAAPIAWVIAPRLRARYWRNHAGNPPTGAAAG
jgi:hypothetical protein